MERVVRLIPIFLFLFSLLPGHSLAASASAGTSTSGGTQLVSVGPEQTRSSSEPMEQSLVLQTGEYFIGPQDLLAVKVFRVEDFDVAVRVDSRGTISLPLIGRVHAAGLTSFQLEKQIAAKLSASYLQNPFVTVFVEEYASQRVTVVGAVNKPGVYALTGPTTLLQAIALAEGLDHLADGSRVQVLRGIGERHNHPANYNVESIRSGKETDPSIRGGDIVVVNKSGGRSVIKGLTDTLRGFVYFGRIP